jgi:hypothetical protein
MSRFGGEARGYAPAMGLMNDDHRVRIAGSDVAVTGETGLIEPTLRLLVDGVEVDSTKASGIFRLQGHLPDGSPVEAEIHQGMFGPTEVAVLHEGAEVVRFKGFVA